MFLELKDIHYRYTDSGADILKGVNLRLKKGEIAALVGHTGSGKSTLVQTINGLLKPQKGNIFIKGKKVGSEISFKEVRRMVGLVFQYPEHQLFEENVFQEVAFGPKNLGLSAEEIKRRVQRALQFVNLDYEELKERSPFGLSGGQKRRIAIAGVLAMEPELLILDEPIAGLDPRGRRKLLDQLVNLNHQYGITILMISHRMEEAASRANKLFVMNDGLIALSGTPKEVFSQRKRLLEIGLELPPLTEVLWQLRERGKDVRVDLFSVEEVEGEILRYWRDNCCSKM